MSFAKIFESEKYGQLCCIAGSQNDEGKPEIRVHCQPEKFGVCSYSVMFSDTDKGWASQERAFKIFTVKEAEALAQDLFKVVEDF